jgi:peptidoglycan/xylan/chitin deacetylase (PgdA/CDA1 family)
MIRTLAKLGARLRIDSAANNVLERLYRNTSSQNPLARRFQVLAYHKISPAEHPLFEPIDPVIFEQHVRFLKDSYRVMDLHELVERSGKGDVPERAVAITFDDGYQDNYEYAFPILKKYGVPATIFVATGVIGTDDLLWHDRVFDAFRFATRERARISSAELPELILDSPQQQQRSLRRTLIHAKTLYGEARRRFVEEVEEALRPDSSRQPKQRMLNWNQIREMHRNGISFGSHTVTHPIIARLPREEMLKEMRDSKQRLTDELSTRISAFAYPNGQAGDYNEETKAVLKECGYTCAVTCGRGFNRVFADPFELRRGQPWDQDIQLFRLRFFLQRHGLEPQSNYS